MATTGSKDSGGCAGGHGKKARTKRIKETREMEDGRRGEWKILVVNVSSCYEEV